MREKKNVQNQIIGFDLTSQGVSPLVEVITKIKDIASINARKSY